MTYDPRPGESSAQYWARKRWEKPVFVKFLRSWAKKSTKYGVTTPAHPELRACENTEGTTMLVKIFRDRLQISMNGPFMCTVSDLEALIEEIRNTEVSELVDEAKRIVDNRPKPE